MSPQYLIYNDELRDVIEYPPQYTNPSVKHKSAESTTYNKIECY